MTLLKQIWVSTQMTRQALTTFTYTHFWDRGGAVLLFG